MLQSVLNRLPRLAPGDNRVSYAATLGLVVVALGLRFLLQPIFGSNNAFTAFYPVVILTAYLFGRRTAIFAAVISGAAAYWCFVEPTFAWKAEAHALAPLVFFAANCAVAIYLIVALLKTVEKVGNDQSRAMATAASHAELFRELNERVSHHLQLVAGVLALQAAGEPEKKVSQALSTASERSVLLSRIHRDFSGRGHEEVEFAAFARQLVRATLVSRNQPIDRIVLEGDELRLPAEQATSLAVALLECVGALLGRQVASRLKISIQVSPAETTLRIADLEPANSSSVTTMAGGYLLSAVVAQLGGRVEITADSAGGGLDIAFPRSIYSESAVEKPIQTFH
jgi:two-component sensor histidine kinase